MSSFTLDDIRAAADKKYGVTEVTDLDVRLVNVLRLPKERREALSNLQKNLGDEDADHGEVLREAFRIVAESPEQAERLISAVGDDLAVLFTIFREYTSGTELGEASASQD